MRKRERDLHVHNGHVDEATGPEAEGAEGCLCYIHIIFRDSGLVIHDPAFRPEGKACDGIDTGFQSVLTLRCR
jgi:hypothetical protein